MLAVRSERWTLITASLVVLAAVAIAFILSYTRSVMVPFVLAVFIVVTVAPLADFLELRTHFPRWLSIATLLTLVLTVTAAFLLLFVVMASRVVDEARPLANLAYLGISKLLNEEPEAVAPDIGPNLPFPDVPAPDREIVLDAQPIPDAPAAKRPVSMDDVKEEIVPAIKNLLGRVVSWAHAAFGSIIAILGAYVLMMIFVLFLLAARDPRNLPGGVYAHIEDKIRRYVTAKTVICTVTGVLVGVILWLFGMKLVLVFAVLTFLLNFIPSLGSIIATILPLPFAWGQFVLNAENPSWWPVIGVIVVPGALQMVIGNVLEPRIMGKGLDLHPIAILFALVFWTILWGPVGAILAAPITAAVRIAILQFRSLAVVSNLMAGTLPELREQEGG